MDDSELLNEALRRGGADAVTKQLPKGIDEELNKDWMPPADGKGEVEARAGQLSSAAPPPPPPPPGGRGGPGPPGKSGPSLKINLSKGGRRGRGPGGGLAARQQMMAMMGKPLSGGQWQRIALARAFMRSDEADLVVFELSCERIGR